MVATMAKQSVTSPVYITLKLIHFSIKLLNSPYGTYIGSYLKIWWLSCAKHNKFYNNSYLFYSVLNSSRIWIKLL